MSKKLRDLRKAMSKNGQARNFAISGDGKGAQVEGSSISIGMFRRL